MHDTYTYTYNEQFYRYNGRECDKISVNTIKIGIHESHKLNLYTAGSICITKYKYSIENYIFIKKTFLQIHRLYNMVYEILNTQVAAM